MAIRRMRFELDIGQMATVLKAIADPTRQQILRILERGPTTVGDIVCAFDLAQPTISRHLGVLKGAGLVDATRDGKHIYYSIRAGNLRSACCDIFGSFDCCADLFTNQE